MTAVELKLEVWLPHLASPKWTLNGHSESKALPMFRLATDGGQKASTCSRLESVYCSRPLVGWGIAASGSLAASPSALRMRPYGHFPTDTKAPEQGVLDFNSLHAITEAPSWR
jgi:hypothetical protein